MVFSVHNNLKVTITVQSITSALDTTNYPAPPAVLRRELPDAAHLLGLLHRGRGRRRHQPRRPHRAERQRLQPERLRELHLPLHLLGSANYTDSTHRHGPRLGAQPLDLGPVGDLHGHGDGGHASTDARRPTRDGQLLQVPDLGPVRLQQLQPARQRDHRHGGKATCTHLDALGRDAPTSRPSTASGTDFNLSVSNGSVAQVVNSSTVGTSTALTSSPNPSGYGSPVTLTATVTKSSGTGTPTGTVTFHLGSPSGTVVGTGTLNASGQASCHDQLAPGGDRQPLRRLLGRHPLLGLHLAGAGPERDRSARPSAPGPTPTSSTGTRTTP